MVSQLLIWRWNNWECKKTINQAMKICKELQPWFRGVPGLLIFLCDGNAESYITINKTIDYLIQLNDNGACIKDSCYIVVFDKDMIKSISSGWLSEYEKYPCDIKSTQKRVPDGIGGFVSIDARIPIWVKEMLEKPKCRNIADVLDSINNIIVDWNNDIKSKNETEYIKVMSCPIVIDAGICLKDYSCESVVLSGISIIRQNAFLFGLCHDIDCSCTTETIYDSIPQKLNNLICSRNGIDCSENVYCSENNLLSLLFELSTHNIGYRYYW